MAEGTQEPLGGSISSFDSRSARARLLAFEIRSSRMGFVVLEGPTKLLDWGVRRFGAKEGPLRQTVSSRIEGLLRTRHPDLVVVRDRTYYTAAANKRFATIISSVRAVTKRHSSKFKLLIARRVRRHFALAGFLTKHEIAAELSRQFVELSWKLPSRRKAYESEAHAMVIFDAAATGVAFIVQQTHENGRNDPDI